MGRLNINNRSNAIKLSAKGPVFIDMSFWATFRKLSAKS
jgi:hypothetical protein